MSSIASRRLFSTTARRLSGEEKAASRSGSNTPLILGAGVAVAFVGAATYFRNTKNAAQENPWEEETLAKHKVGKEAPSALNAVVLPSVTLPKDVHDRLNKWGKEGYP
ncbi:hypothetical protein SAPIO_CDS10055 [Scedosporium apiospermum]|uniref:Uncharacterized protein n=1 Tax=Pseudallescheria apiosperma TaxID=563466 RepID=A0A084FW98_PSEDA|nr:uncharacterized protein SAPIO_CDS10055 [Scedosporium apiospermum]KEZ39360.1 hypothetical protein SAPIO_CDS10055 [Scedosporium apiospermum]